MPPNCSEPNTVSQITDCVSTRMYQPRISVSISNAQEVSRSAGHSMRYERLRNGARNGGAIPFGKVA